MRRFRDIGTRLGDSINGIRLSLEAGSPQEHFNEFSRIAPVNTTRGYLFAFEGPDGVGKTSIAGQVAERLNDEGTTPVGLLAFPGNEAGTLGHFVYRLHHDRASMGIRGVAPAGLHLLHLAAHVDAIQSVILPRLRAGHIVLLDRFWWSLVVYGQQLGVERALIDSMIAVEKLCWHDVTPACLFLIRRPTALCEQKDSAIFESLANGYESLAVHEQSQYPVLTVNNAGTLQAAVDTVTAHVRSVLQARVAK